MPIYDALLYDPPAPVAEVTLRDVNRGALQPNVMLLIDTGADITLLPRLAVERLGVKPISGLEYELVGFDGRKSPAKVVELDMILLRRAFRGKYLLIDGDHGVLGRDVLASLALIIDGPHQQWVEHPNTDSLATT
jgi:hypothetical protein